MEEEGPAEGGFPPIEEVKLSIESEDVERHALAALHAAADDAIKPRLHLQSVTVGGALVSIAGALPLTCPH